MDDKAIKQIQDAAAAVALSQGVLANINHDHPVAALPDNFKVHDLEKFLPNRTRYRASLATESLATFTAYHDSQDPAPVFINPDNMAATAIYNLGDVVDPGHGDHTSTLTLEKTAPYRAYLFLAKSSPHTQKAVAEWVEDWRDHVTAYDSDGNPIHALQLAATLRNIDIEAARKINSTDSDFSATRSTLENIEAKSGVGKMPSVVVFTCEPYLGLPVRQFKFRIGVMPTEKGLNFATRRIQEEADTQAMADDFVQVVRAHLGETATIYQGTYTL